jgi:hypothetical protein
VVIVYNAPMRTITIAVLLASCGGADDAQTYDCDQLARTVTQRHGTCRLAYDPNAIFMNGCPWTVDAYCLPDGKEASCPDGWSIGCAEGPGGELIDCHYGPGTSCDIVEPNVIVEFEYVQTLNGVDGLGVLDLDTDRCEFRPCSPI